MTGLGTGQVKSEVNVSWNSLYNLSLSTFSHAGRHIRGRYMAVCTTCWLSQSDKLQMGFHFCVSAPLLQKQVIRPPGTCPKVDSTSVLVRSTLSPLFHLLVCHCTCRKSRWRLMALFHCMVLYGSARLGTVRLGSVQVGLCFHCSLVPL